jgi:DsbC/DsbD-like thiol-disulfide interchange protein
MPQPVAADTAHAPSYNVLLPYNITDGSGGDSMTQDLNVFYSVCGTLLLFHTSLRRVML